MSFRYSYERTTGSWLYFRLRVSVMFLWLHGNEPADPSNESLSKYIKMLIVAEITFCTKGWSSWKKRKTSPDFFRGFDQSGVASNSLGQLIQSPNNFTNPCPPDTRSRQVFVLAVLLKRFPQQTNGQSLLQIPATKRIQWH